MKEPPWLNVQEGGYGDISLLYLLNGLVLYLAITSPDIYFKSVVQLCRAVCQLTVRFWKSSIVECSSTRCGYGKSMLAPISTVLKVCWLFSHSKIICEREACSFETGYFACSYGNNFSFFIVFIFFF